MLFIFNLRILIMNKKKKGLNLFLRETDLNVKKTAAEYGEKQVPVLFPPSSSVRDRGQVS